MFLGEETFLFQMPDVGANVQLELISANDAEGVGLKSILSRNGMEVFDVCYAKIKEGRTIGPIRNYNNNSLRKLVREIKKI